MLQALSTKCGSCLFSRDAFLGDAVGLRRISLKFSTPTEELCFLHHYHARLVKTWPVWMLVCIVFNIAWTPRSVVFIASLSSGVDDERREVEFVLMVARCVSGLLCALQAMCCISSRLSGRIGPSAKENFVIAMIIYSQWAVFFGVRYYLCKLLGYSNPHAVYGVKDLPAPHSDSSQLMLLTTLLVFSHVAIPLRWCKLFVAELMGPVCYAVGCIWSPETNKATVMAYMVLVTCVSAFGKRQLEMNERVVFSSLMSEKTLRMQAEFELSQSSCKRRSDDVTSVPETTFTGEVFNGLDSPEDRDSSLTTLLSVGKAEQWLIDESDISIDRATCLGAGGFGIVYAGQYCVSPVALKFRKNAGIDKNVYDLGNELRLLRKLRHPNIVLLHGACLSIQHGDLVLVMEKVGGQPMTKFVAENDDQFQFCQCLIGICHGLAYLHSRKPVIVHGDLKPQNVMIEQRGCDVHAKMLDFGLARLVTCNARPGGGTYRWLAPEVLASKSRPSSCADVYAVGLMIFFCCTGRQPFENYGHMLLKHRAKGKGDCKLLLTWPDHLSTFALQCRRLVKYATQEDQFSRPLAQELLQDIVALDAYQTGCESAIGNSSQAESSRETSGGFWQSLAEERQVVFAKQCAAENSDMQLWAKNVAVAETFTRPAQRSQNAKEELAHPPPDRSPEKGSGPSTTALQLAYPELLPTPEVFMVASILDIILSWNCAVTCTCCRFHGYLGVLANLVQKLQKNPCSHTALDPSSIQQCPVCLALDLVDEDESCERPCRICGHAGSAVGTCEGKRSRDAAGAPLPEAAWNPAADRIAL